MAKTDFDLQIHATVLIGWAVNTLGKALFFSTLVAMAGGVLAVVAGDIGVVYLGGLLATIAFSLMLYTASPPLPRADD